MNDGLTDKDGWREKSGNGSKIKNTMYRRARRGQRRGGGGH